MHSYTLQQLASIVEVDYKGNPNQVITNISTLKLANKTDLSFFCDPRLMPDLLTTKAGAIIVTAEMAQKTDNNTLISANPYALYARLTHLFYNEPDPLYMIHPSACIASSVKLPESVSIGANVVIEDNVTIGKHSVIGAGCYIGHNVSIGKRCQLYPNVSLYYDTKLDDYVTLHSGAVIGADGFGYAPENDQWIKIVQLGAVRIGFDVEIGANTCIDRGAITDTIIEDGVKIDNLVQIAHNVRVGENTAIAGCVGIAGSTSIGENCQIGGGASINGHITLADGVIVAGNAMVTKSIAKAGVYSSGTGLQTNRDWRRSVVRFRQLDDMAKRIQSLEKKITELSKTKIQEEVL